MPLISSGSTRIWYQTKGNGTPVLLCNGWGGSSDSWSQEMVRMLSERHMVALVDNRGTGRSDKPLEPYTMEAMAGDSAAVLKELGCGPAHVLGHSMGGYIAQALAIYYPEKVKSLILCATTSGSVSRVPYGAGVASEWAKVSDPALTTYERVKSLVYLLYPSRYVDPRREELIKEESYDENPTPIYALRNQSAAIAGFDAYEQLPHLSIPALILTGDEDSLIPPENSRILAQRIPGAELKVLSGLGHGLLKQDTGKVVGVVLDFLSRVDSRNSV